MKKLIAIVSLALTLPALAAEPIVNQQKELECLVGSWKVSGTVKAPGSDQLIAVKGSYDCKQSGAAVSCALNLSGLPEGMRYQTVETWAFNAGDDSVHLFSVDNMGSAGDVKGRIANDAFVGRHQSTIQAQAYTRDVKLAFASKDRFTLVCTCNFGSKLDLTATRA